MGQPKRAQQGQLLFSPFLQSYVIDKFAYADYVAIKDRKWHQPNDGIVYETIVDCYLCGLL